MFVEKSTAGPPTVRFVSIRVAGRGGDRQRPARAGRCDSTPIRFRHDSLAIRVGAIRFPISRFTKCISRFSIPDSLPSDEVNVVMQNHGSDILIATFARTLGAIDRMSNPLVLNLDN